MDFRRQKPIFQQIADRLCERIVAGEWEADGRIASVREVAAELGVTPNTAMRSFEYLQQREIIYNRRGTGYYVNPEARNRIIEMQRKEFLEEEVPVIMQKMQLLNLTLEDLKHFVESRNENNLQ